MSESRGGSRDWRMYVQDMIEFAERALSYVEGMDLEDFLTDERTYDAVLRNIELIGKAATHVPVRVRQLEQAIEWGNIIGTRNQLAHVYLGIDNDIVWDTLNNDIPELIALPHQLLQSSNQVSGRNLVRVYAPEAAVARRRGRVSLAGGVEMLSLSIVEIMGDARVGGYGAGDEG